MSPKETDDLISRMEDKYFSPKDDKKKDKKEKKKKEESNSQDSPGKKSKIRTLFDTGKKKLKGIVIGGAIAGTLLLGYGAFDFFTKRQDYPVRNVLYRLEQTINIAGGDKRLDAKNADRITTYHIYRGGLEGGQTKVEDILATAEYHLTDEAETFNLKKQDNTRLANAYFKKERVQAGISLAGSRLFTDQYGTVMKTSTSGVREAGDARNPLIEEDAFLAYRIEPERGKSEVEINVLQIGGNKQLTNRLEEIRSFPLGWLWGINFRKGTNLEYYNISDKDPKMQELFRFIAEFNKTQSTNQGIREDLIKKIKELEQKIPRRTIYKDYEDGIIDVNFQESTLWLCQNPSWLKRQGFAIVDFLEQAKERLTLGLLDKAVHGEGIYRIENHWNLLPGNIPLLNKLKYSTATRTYDPFGKTNNGGYEIIDDRGTLVLVKIKDFAKKYGNDLLYLYYLDKNGDGRIDKKNELIGQVLHHMTYGQKDTTSEEIGKEKGKKDITYNAKLTFMGGKETDAAKRYNDFLLCAYIESFMPDQLNRGYGKHSILGIINEARSNVILMNNPTIFENLSRALTPENSLVAAHDIYRVLRAGQRPFAQKFLEKSGIQIHYVDPEVQQKVLEGTNIQINK